MTTTTSIGDTTNCPSHQASRGVGSVLTAVPQESRRLAQVLSAAFADNPVSDWLFNGEQDQHHPAFFTAFLRWAFRGGRVQQSGDGTAVAVWIDYTVPPDELLDDFHTEIIDAVGRHRARWLAFDHATANEHLAVPHWWLAFLGVLPAARGRGHASRLLCDSEAWQARSPAYLEATSRRLGGFYQRHGFQATDTITVPSGPTVHGMVRPRNSSSAALPALHDPVAEPDQAIG